MEKTKMNKTIVIVPTKALAKNQVERVNQQTRREVAYFLEGDGLNYEDTMSLLLQKPEIRLVYFTPEKLAKNAAVQKAIQVLNNDLRQILNVVVDEAHNLILSDETEEGSRSNVHHAREYPNAITFLQGLNPPVRFIATTATATQAARTAIKEKLKFGPTNSSLKFNPRESYSYELILPIYRENIEIQVLPRTSKQRNLQFLVAERHCKQTGRRLEPLPEGVGLTLIYVTKRDTARQIAKVLEQGGLKVGLYYKEGRTNAENAAAHQAFMDSTIDVLVATGQSFGEGIDHPELRHVILYCMPKSLEQLVQQIGRPGRDGKRARCTVFAAPQDFMEAGHTPNSRELLGQFLEATTTCRWHTLSRLCGEDASFLVEGGCKKCDVCCDTSPARTFNFAQEVEFFLDLLYACEARCQQSAKSWTVLFAKAKEHGTPLRARYDKMPPTTLRGKAKRGHSGTTQDESKLRAFLDFTLVPAKLVSCERRAQVGPGGQDRGHAVYFLSVEGETMCKKLRAAPGVETPSVMLPVPWHLSHPEYQQEQCLPDGDEDDGEFFCMHCDKEVADEGDARCAGAQCKKGLHASCGPALGCSPPYLDGWFCPGCKSDPDKCYLVRTILDTKLDDNKATNKLEHYYRVLWQPCAKNAFVEDEETWEPRSHLGESHPALIAFEKEHRAAPAPSPAPPHGDTAPAPPSQLSAGASSSSMVEHAAPPAERSPPLVFVEAYPASDDAVEAPPDLSCEACRGSHRAHTCVRRRVQTGKRKAPISNGHRPLEGLSITEACKLLAVVFPNPSDSEVVNRYQEAFKKNEINGQALKDLIRVNDKEQGPDEKKMRMLGVNPFHQGSLCRQIKEWWIDGVPPCQLPPPASDIFEMVLPELRATTGSRMLPLLPSNILPPFMTMHATPLSNVLPPFMPMHATPPSNVLPPFMPIHATPPARLQYTWAPNVLGLPLVPPILAHQQMKATATDKAAAEQAAAENVSRHPVMVSVPPNLAGHTGDTDAAAQQMKAAADKALSDKAADEQARELLEKQLEQERKEKHAASKRAEKTEQALEQEAGKREQINRENQALKAQLTQQQQQQRQQHPQRHDANSSARHQQQQTQAASRAMLEELRLATLGQGPKLPQPLMQIFVSSAELTQRSQDWLNSQLIASHAQEIVAKYETDDRVCRARAFALMAAVLECKELNLTKLNEV